MSREIGILMKRYKLLLQSSYRGDELEVEGFLRERFIEMQATAN